jgi:transposase
MYLEIQTSRKNPVGILRSSYRKGNRVKHEQHGRISGKTLEELKLLQLALRGEVIPKYAEQSFKILAAKEYGASYAIHAFAKQIGLARLLYSRNEDWVKSVMAMIVGRIVYQGSKLALCNQHHNSSLWEISGIACKPDVEMHCYNPMDKLLARQVSIQKQLAKKHMRNGHLVLYDITSTYFEGDYQDSELVAYGYNRDKKRNHEQVVVGLLCSMDGCPVSVEIYPGNTSDQTTVIDKVNQVKNEYDIDKIIFVGDRGMLTKSNRERITNQGDISTITALTRKEIFSLIEGRTITPELFDEFDIHQVIDPDNPKTKYCLCKNPFMAKQDAKTREVLITKTEELLKEISKYKRAVTIEQLGARVGKALLKYKVGKLFSWKVDADAEKTKSTNHKLTWELNNNQVSREKLLDGCYIIRAELNNKEQINANEIVTSYKNLTQVEQAFRNLKTVQLEMRPVYHKKDERIKAHIFLCMLSYYVQWGMMKKLKPLFENDQKGKNRRWTFENVINTLMQITKNKITANGIEYFQLSELTDEQKIIYDLLGVKIM